MWKRPPRTAAAICYPAVVLLFALSFRFQYAPVVVRFLPLSSAKRSSGGSTAKQSSLALTAERFSLTPTTKRPPVGTTAKRSDGRAVFSCTNREAVYRWTDGKRIRRWGFLLLDQPRSGLHFLLESLAEPEGKGMGENLGASESCFSRQASIRTSSNHSSSQQNQGRDNIEFSCPADQRPRATVQFPLVCPTFPT